MIHGTPVLDIKPYIADYDLPQNLIEPLRECELRNNQYTPKAVPWSDGKTDGCAPQQISGREAPQPCGRTEEKPACAEDRTSGEHGLRHSDTAAAQRSSPEHREVAAHSHSGFQSGSGQRLSVAEAQIGSCRLERSFSGEGADERPRKGKEVVVPQENSAEVQPVAPHCPSMMADAVHRSVVPAWVREAPVATLAVRFTPHAQMDLEHLGSKGKPDIFHFLFLSER